MTPTAEDIHHLVDAGGPQIVYQPIVELRTGRTAGYEALARFEQGTPDDWFGAAAACDLTPELEVSAITAALPALTRIAPAYLSLNASAETLVGDALAAALLARLGPRLMVELTEHDVVANYDLLRARLMMLRRAGVGSSMRIHGQGIRLAVDDFGAGHSGFRHVLELQPDVVKLDVSLIRGIDSDPDRADLVTLFVSYVTPRAMTLVAEGVETESERATLMGLGVSHAQGFLLARPGALP